MTDIDLQTVQTHALMIPPIGPLVSAFGEDVGEALRRLKDEVPLLLAEIERLRTEVAKYRGFYEAHKEPTP